MTPPPLSLYVHLPWCVQKCPYCDFNSHAGGDPASRRRYLDALLLDLAAEASLAAGRRIESVFLGGGTPSVFSPGQISRLLDRIIDMIAQSQGAPFLLNFDERSMAGLLRQAVQQGMLVCWPLGGQVVVAAHREHLAGELPQLLQNPGAADVACVHGQVTAPYDLEDVRAQVPMRVRYDGHADGAGSC